MLQVALAAQLLSSSVAKALQLLLDLGVEEFSDAAPTIQFLQMVDRAFDILNSRTPFGKGFKSPVTSQNIGDIVHFAAVFEDFILTLEDANGDRIVRTRKSTGFVGFIFCLRSLVTISHELLKLNSIKYVLSYKFSQDHLELFFNAIRRACGWNNNPTTVQFLHIYKRMLMRAGVEPSSYGNCVSFAEDEEDETPIDDSGVSHDMSLSRFVVNVVAYVAGFVVRKTLPRLPCTECRCALVSTSVEDIDPVERHLLTLKNNGGLVVPSKDVIDLLKIVENCYRVMEDCRGGYHIASVVMRELINTSLFNTMHFVESDHFYHLVQSLILCYVDLRGYHIARNHNIQMISKRYRLTKQILFDSM